MTYSFAFKHDLGFLSNFLKVSEMENKILEFCILKWASSQWRNYGAEINYQQVNFDCILHKNGVLASKKTVWWPEYAVNMWFKFNKNRNMHDIWNIAQIKSNSPGPCFYGTSP